MITVKDLKEEDNRLTEVVEFINNISLEELKDIYVKAYFLK